VLVQDFESPISVSLPFHKQSGRSMRVQPSYQLSGGVHPRTTSTTTSKRGRTRTTKAALS